jgi:hypothetical protein
MHGNVHIMRRLRLPKNCQEFLHALTRLLKVSLFMFFVRYIFAGVVDPDPVGSASFCRIRIRIQDLPIRIRIRIQIRI